MKARNRPRLAGLRLIMAAFRQVEIDEKTEVDDVRALAILDRMTRQRKDALALYQTAGRDDLAQRESLELSIIAEFLPGRLSPEEIGALVDAAITKTGASNMRDMGRVMSRLKPDMQGRADMGEVSSMVRARLA